MPEDDPVRLVQKFSANAVLLAALAMLFPTQHYFWGLELTASVWMKSAATFLLAAVYFAVSVLLWRRYDSCIVIWSTKPYALTISLLFGFAVCLSAVALWIYLVPLLKDMKPGYFGNLLILGAIAYLAYQATYTMNRKILKFE